MRFTLARVILAFLIFTQSSSASLAQDDDEDYATRLKRDIYYAAVKGDDAFLKRAISVLEKNGDSVPEWINSDNPDLIGGGGETPLLAATTGEHRSTALLLLDAGADPNIVLLNPQGKVFLSPLHSAALHGDVVLVKALLAHGARRDIRDAWNRTPADRATIQQVRQLLRVAVSPTRTRSKKRH